jgi:hypothetical protein
MDHSQLLIRQQKAPPDHLRSVAPPVHKGWKGACTTACGAVVPQGSGEDMQRRGFNSVMQHSVATHGFIGVQGLCVWAVAGGWHEVRRALSMVQSMNYAALCLCLVDCGSTCGSTSCKAGPWLESSVGGAAD